MDDKKYFLQYKKSFETVFINEDNCAFIKDNDFKYQIVTNKMAKLYGVSNHNDMLNKNIEEIAHIVKFENKSVIKQFIKQDLNIKQQKKGKTYLEVITWGGESKIYLQHKYPIINPETNNFVGIRGHVTNLLWPHAVKILLKMHGAKGLLINHNNHNNNNKTSLKDYPLTNIQHMVLFLCLNNYSYSEIAVLLNEFGYTITPVRVNDYLEQLKLIFHIRNKSQLIEKAIGLNFHLFLPEGLFNKIASIEISEEKATIISGTISNKKKLIMDTCRDGSKQM